MSIGRYTPKRCTLIATIALVASGCTLIPPPDGAAPLRYRDKVFTTVDTTADLTYGSAPDINNVAEVLKLDLYEPHGDTATARPAIVLVHGGAFFFGDKKMADIVDLANEYAKRGFVAVSIDYRLLAPSGCVGPDDPSPTCVAAAFGAQHDAQAAVRWLRTNATTYRIDVGRIAMQGSSAGAMTALLAAYRSDDPGTSGNPGPSSAIAGAISLSGGVPGIATFMSVGDAPALLFHGTADDIIPFDWTVATYQAAIAAGLYANLETLPGAGHVPYALYRDLIVGQSVNFLYQQLDLSHAQQ